MHQAWRAGRNYRRRTYAADVVHTMRRNSRLRNRLPMMVLWKNLGKKKEDLPKEPWQEWDEDNPRWPRGPWWKYRASNFTSDPYVQVTFQTPQGRFVVKNHPRNQTFLETAWQLGIKMPYNRSCMIGRCTECIGMTWEGHWAIHAGDMAYQLHGAQPCLLQDHHRDEGYVHTCMAIPVDNCTIMTHMEDWFYANPHNWEPHGSPWYDPMYNAGRLATGTNQQLMTRDREGWPAQLTSLNSDGGDHLPKDADIGP